MDLMGELQDICYDSYDGGYETFRDFYDGNESSVDINYRFEGGRTFLMYACNELSFDLIEFLIEKGADIYAVDDLGFCPLFFVMDAYNVIIERINVYCDNRYLSDEFKQILKRCKLENKSLQDNLPLIIEEYESTHSLEKFLGCISRDEYYEVLSKIIDGTFDGEIKTVARCIKIFTDRGVDLNHSYNGKTLMDMCFDIGIGFNDGYMHYCTPSIRESLNAVRYLVDRGVEKSAIQRFLDSSSNLIKIDREELERWLRDEPYIQSSVAMTR